jgi:hypothetical protein
MMFTPTYHGTRRRLPILGASLLHGLVNIQVALYGSRFLVAPSADRGRPAADQRDIRVEIWRVPITRCWYEDISCGYVLLSKHIN